jgi:hypothetical protein
VCLSFRFRRSRAEFGGLGYLVSEFLGRGMEFWCAEMDRYLVLCCFGFVWAESFEQRTLYRAYG